MNTTDRNTVFSPDRKYRYTLWREWYGVRALPGSKFPVEGNKSCHYVQFIGLNPSTADETKDDPTIRRCIAFAKSWGFGAICMTNLFAWRETDPKQMMKAVEPVGMENNDWLKTIAADAGLIVAAWGKNGAFQGRGTYVKFMLSEIKPIHCLRTIKSGAPEHPLYLPKDLKPVLL